MTLSRTVASGAAALIAMVAAILPGATAARAADGPPEGARIVSITTNGTGCKGPLLLQWADAGGFRIRYENLEAKAGAGAGALDLRKACQVAVGLAVPAGYTVALSSVDVARNASLPAGATARSRTQNYWAGQVSTGSWTDTLAGPYDDSWNGSHQISPAEQLRLPCGVNRPLNIITDVSVTRSPTDPAASVVAGFDVQGETMNASYGLTWSRCP